MTPRPSIGDLVRNCSTEGVREMEGNAIWSIDNNFVIRQLLLYPVSKILAFVYSWMGEIEYSNVNFCLLEDNFIRVCTSSSNGFYEIYKFHKSLKHGTEAPEKLVIF
jgi:hypothetical protein